MGLLKSAEFKVGLLVVSVATLIGYMSMQVSSDPSYLGRSRKAWFLISNAGGLIKNSAIKTAGIPIGVISDIRLQDGKARVDLTIRSEVKLTVSAGAEIRAVGILGDKYVELFPGVPTDPPLPDGGQIMNVKDTGSLDNLISQVSEITGSLKGVAKILESSVQDEGDRTHVLGRIVSNIEKITADIAQVTGDNKEQIKDIVDNIDDITNTLNELISDESDEGLKAGLKKAVASLSRIEPTLKNIEEISGKINNGEGTIGKLVNDDSTIEEINGAIEGVNTMLDSANKLSTAIDFHSEYLGAQGEYKSYIGMRLQPGLDRYYVLQVVDDPVGVEETIDTKTTTGGATTETSETKTYRGKIKFTVLFAKNIYDFTFKGGLIESTGGLGMDYRFFRNRMKFTIEAFNFGDMNLRSNLQYNFYKGFYLVGGVNDALNKSSKYSNYLGVGLLLNNDDLKLFASKMSF